MKNHLHADSSVGDDALALPWWHSTVGTVGVDTVELRLEKFRVLESADLIVTDPPYHAATGKEVGAIALFEQDGQEGRLVSQVAHRRGPVRFVLGLHSAIARFSVAKILGGGPNLAAVSDERIREALELAQTHLREEVGVDADLLGAVVRRLDLFRDVPVGRFFRAFEPAFPLLERARWRRTVEGGQLILRTGARRISLYDKVASLAGGIAKEEGRPRRVRPGAADRARARERYGLPPHLVRLEFQHHGAEVVGERFGIRTGRDLVDRARELPGRYEEAVVDFFSGASLPDRPTGSGHFSYEAMLRALVEAGVAGPATKVLKAAGADRLMEEYGGVEGVRAMAAAVGLSPSQRRGLIRDLRALGAHVESAVVAGAVALRDELYGAFRLPTR